MILHTGGWGAPPPIQIFHTSLTKCKIFSNITRKGKGLLILHTGGWGAPPTSIEMAHIVKEIYELWLYQDRPVDPAQWRVGRPTASIDMLHIFKEI